MLYAIHFLSISAYFVYIGSICTITCCMGHVYLLFILSCCFFKIVCLMLSRLYNPILLDPHVLPPSLLLTSKTMFSNPLQHSVYMLNLNQLSRQESHIPYPNPNLSVLSGMKRSSIYGIVLPPSCPQPEYGGKCALRPSPLSLSLSPCLFLSAKA